MSPIKSKEQSLRCIKRLVVDFWKLYIRNVWGEFKNQGIPFESQVLLDIEYKGELLKQKYKPDFICYNNIIIELKAIKEIANEHQAQVINYLKATEMELGLLVNFGSYPKVEIKRLINL